MEAFPEIGFDDLAIATREPIDYALPVISEPVVSEPVQIQPVVSEPVVAPAPAPAPAPIEPTPTVSDPADWQYAAAMDLDSDPIEPVVAWHSLPEDPLPVESPTVVSNPIEPVYSYPVSVRTGTTRPSYYSQPAVIDVPTELDPVDPYTFQKEDPMLDPICNCITYPCDCDGIPDGGGEPVYTKAIDPILPPPIVDLPATPAAPSLPVDVTVTQLPPTVDPVTGQPSTSSGDAADAGPSTVMIFGFPWYYVAGAAAALFLLSSSDGKR